MNLQVTEGIRRGFERGLLTSASWLANAPDASRAIGVWRALETLRAAGRLPSAAWRRLAGDCDAPFDFGVHLNLTQGRPLTGDRYPAELLRPDGSFPGIFRLFAAFFRHGNKLEAAIERELRAQISRALDFGLTPTHLNGHQYIETAPPVMRVIPKLARRFGIRAVRYSVPLAGWLTHSLRNVGPCRAWLAIVKGWYARGFRSFCEARDLSGANACLGASHAGRVRLSLLESWLQRRGVWRLTEVVLHPGRISDERADSSSDEWRDPLAKRRAGELELLESQGLLHLILRHQLRLGRLRATPFAGSCSSQAPIANLAELAQ